MFLTTKDVMNRYRISRSTLYRWEHTEEFPAPKRFGSVKRWALPELEEFEKIKLCSTVSA